MKRHLQHLGFTNVEEGITSFSFEYNGYSYSIDAEALDDTMTIEEVLHDADMISCCGYTLDRDIMICPACGEHQ